MRRLYCDVPNFVWGSITFQGHWYYVAEEETHALDSLTKVPPEKATIVDQYGRQINALERPTPDNTNAEIRKYMDVYDIAYLVSDTKAELLEKIEQAS